MIEEVKVSTQRRLARNAYFSVANRTWEGVGESVWGSTLERFERRLHDRLRLKIQLIVGFSDALRR